MVLFLIALLALDYFTLLDAPSIEKVHLVGWSDGANIGYEISKSAPDRLASHIAHAGNVTLSGLNPGVESNDVFSGYMHKMAEDYPAPARQVRSVCRVHLYHVVRRQGGWAGVHRLDYGAYTYGSQPVR